MIGQTHQQATLYIERDITDALSDLSYTLKTLLLTYFIYYRHSPSIKKIVGSYAHPWFESRPALLLGF